MPMYDYLCCCRRRRTVDRHTNQPTTVARPGPTSEPGSLSIPQSTAPIRPVSSSSSDSKPESNRIPEAMSSSSNTNLNAINQQVANFLATQRQPTTQQRLRRLADQAKLECEEILDSLQIKAVVTNRTKKYGSLEKKLEGMVQDDAEFRDWISRGNPITDHAEMGDLAGVRIGLYLPNDVIKIVKEVEKRYNVKHLFGTVTGGRDATQGRNLDVAKHGNGPWRSEDRDGSPEYWEHYGYKSWQMVVAWKRPPISGLNYTPRVEIQIGTVVTQAWAEIQHNLIYKRPDDILATPTMKRMIDAINGLAITTEIMLKELDRSLEIAKTEASARLFSNSYHFQDWFKSKYLDNMRPEERRRWVHPPRLGHFLCSWGCTVARHEHMSRNEAPSPDPAHVIRAVPAVYQRLIEKRGLLQARSPNSQQLDISVLILQAAGYVFVSGHVLPVSWKQPDDRTALMLQGSDHISDGKYDHFV